jgi:hypothetical protein
MITLKSSRLPLLNQRFEYDHYRRILSDPTFRAQFKDAGARDFECGKFLWAGIQEGATVLLQRIVLGLEARIPIAVMLELSCRGMLTEGLIAKLQDPYKLKGSSTADCYYNCAPALIDPDFALKRAKPDLWILVKTFYKDVRNPIFHGWYLTDLDAEMFDYIFSVFDKVYVWCDTWCDVLKRINEIGSGKYGRPKARNA